LTEIPLPLKEKADIREKIKRFDDIFGMFLIFITILLSVGSATVTIGILVYFLFPLALWISGHALGATKLPWEIIFKLSAWFGLTFLSLILLINFVFGSSILNFEWIFIFGFSLIILNLLPFFWLKKGVSYYDQKYLIVLASSYILFFYWVVTGQLIIL